MKFDPTAQTIADLRQLRELTGDTDGAQRVAWTPVWDRARAWFRENLNDLPVECTVDAAGNMWTTLRGASPVTVAIGGHIDSVPNGGWLDGSLNLVAGLNVLRSLAGRGTPPVTIQLIDWADEEGARFGRSLFGSSAASGTIDIEAIRHLKDRNGVALPDALANYNLSLDTLQRAREHLRNVDAYLELHIEQGPVLESMNLPLAAVLGTVGIRRHAISYRGQSAHAGTTPMAHRRDALAAAASLALEIRAIAKRHNGVCTIGSVVCSPGISSAVVGQCDILLEQRHLDAAALQAMVDDAKAASARFAASEQVEESWRLIWEIPPIPFHPELIDLAAAAVEEVSGAVHRMPSGALHDASEVARAGVPTAMLFVQSLRGLSHTKEEDTLEQHLKQSVEALERLTESTIQWALRQPSNRTKREV